MLFTKDFGLTRWSVQSAPHVRRHCRLAWSVASACFRSIG